MEKTQQILRRVILVLFLLAFGYVFFASMLKISFNNNSGLPVIFTIIASGIMILVYKLSAHVSDRQAHFALYGFITIAVIIQIIVGAQLRYVPMFDIDAVFGGGREWALTGDFPSYRDYFNMQTPNFGGLYLFRCVFSVYKIFGGTDFYMAAVVFNTLLLQGFVWSMWYLGGHLAGGARGRVTALALIGGFLPFYTMGAAFYTDALSMPFIAMTFAFYFIARNGKSRRKQLIFYALVGVSSAIGAIIKVTALIALIALVLDFVLNTKKWIWADIKSRAAGVLTAIGATAVIMLSFYGYMGTQFGPERENARVPFTHWIMMGLAGDGQYNPQDYDFTFSFPTYTEKKKAISEEIRRRVNERGVDGMLSLWGTKLAISFESGIFKQHDFFHLDPQNQSALHEYVLPDKQHFRTYDFVATSLMLALMAMGLFGAVAGFFKNKFVMPYLCMVGFAMFLVLWETNNRIALNHLPVLMICALMGLAQLENLCGISLGKNSDGSEDEDIGETDSHSKVEEKNPKTLSKRKEHRRKSMPKHSGYSRLT